MLSKHGLELIERKGQLDGVVKGEFVAKKLWL